MILGSEGYLKLLFLHAFTGCDTISSIYRVRKATIFKKLISKKHLQEAVLVFTANSWSHEEIKSAGNKAMSIIFKGNTNQTLNPHRHKQLIDKVATAKLFIKQETTPTESTTKCHKFWTCFQVVQWRGENNSCAVD